MDLSFNHTSMDLRERFFSLLDSLSALRALTQLELDGLTEEQVIEKALGELVRYQNLENCSIFRLEGSELRCVVGTSINESHGMVAGLETDSKTRRNFMRFAPGEGIMGIALQTGQLQYCRDCAQNASFKPNPSPGGDLPGSLICVPIKMANDVLGVLNASHPLPEYFEPWQQHTLSLFCSSLGQMLHNHRMLHDLEYLVDQRTHELRTALQEAEGLKQKYEQLSSVDELTGLPNRRYFFDQAEALVSRAKRYELPCSLMLMDVDFFKRVNDNWGHTTGDRVLCMIADVLKDEIRSGDIVARLGGEEFVVLLPNTGVEGTELIAQRIQERLLRIELKEEAATNLEITACIGITRLTPEGHEERSESELVDQLYTEADRAMYQCKREGRNRRKVFDGSEHG